LKIALDATYSTGDNLTGVGTYCREILWGLPALDPDSRFLFCYRPHRFARSYSSFLPRRCRRALLFDSLLYPADLFHGLNQRLPRARYRRKVSTFHDLFVLTGDYSTPEFRERFARQARDAASRSDLIIAVSRFTAGHVEELLGIDRSRLRVIHHGVHLPTQNEPFQKKARKIVLHVGSIQKRKNIVRLVKAFERLDPDWHLVLAGSTGFGAEEILREIEPSPRRANIHLPGYVNSRQLEGLYRAASMLAFPSLDEGFGIPILEAMAWGVPVVTSNRSALPEAAGDAAIHVNPEDVDELAFAMRTLAENEGLRKSMILAGLARAAEFSWRKAVEATWSVYKELAG